MPANHCDLWRVELSHESRQGTWMFAHATDNHFLFMGHLTHEVMLVIAPRLVTRSNQAERT
jgi:hypothetical protein